MRAVDDRVLHLAVYLRVRRWTHAALLAAAHILHGLLLRALTIHTLLAKWASAWQSIWWVAPLGLTLGALEDLCVFASVYALYWLVDKHCSVGAGGGSVGAASSGRQPVARSPRAAAPEHEHGVAVDNESVEVVSVSLGSSSPRPRQSAAASPLAVLPAVPPSPASPAAPQHLTLLRAWLADMAPNALRFVGFALVFALSNALFAVDAVLVRTRQLRFSLGFLRMYVHERAAASELQIDDRELRVLREHAALTVGMALLVGYLGAVWLNPAEWDVLRALHRARVRRLGWTVTRRYVQLVARRDRSSARSDGPTHNGGGDVSVDGDVDGRDCAPQPSLPQRVCARVSTRLLLALLLALLLIATIALAKLVPSIVAMVGMNASLGEPLRLVSGLELFSIRHAVVSRGRRMRDFVEHATEDAELFSSDSLYRRTRGFRGPLAFNVSIASGEQLNVLVVVIESFRQQDSRYLFQDARYDARYGADMPSLTPQFDRWARRGVAFRNMWSSWRTSRALETILFGQVPYDSVTSTGTTNGRADVALAGLPQFFKARGYECVFTTGTRTDYEDWDTFLPAHGFDHVLGMWDVADIASDEVGIDVSEGEQFMTYWGVHDHVSFDVLGYLLQKQHVERRNGTFHAPQAPQATATAPRRKSSALDTHKPWFVTHFTISSHVPFDERPDWYHRYGHEIPDFGPFYSSRRGSGSGSGNGGGDAADAHTELRKNYAEMRYFTDLTFGHFMDNLNASGVLADTLVFVTGDHGQAPERGSATPEQDQMAATRVAGALIAEGRLGASAGLLFDDVASHADLLNTLADIIGVPGPHVNSNGNADGNGDSKGNDASSAGGFLQSGVGHSLKRAVPFGERVVHSNNPAVNMAAVQGHTRMEYYSRVSDAVRVYNTEFDLMQARDVMRELSPARVREILSICADGRMLSDYFKHRWDHACILAPTC